MQTARARAGEILAGSPLDDGDIDAGQRQLARQHEPRWATARHHHRVLGHTPPPQFVGSGFSRKLCRTTRVLPWVASQSPPSANSRRAGAVCALAAAAVWLVVSVITNLLPALVFLRPLGLLVVLGAPPIAGLLSAKVGGLARDGALAGFWCGLVIAVLIAVIGVGVDNAFATTLVHTSWSNDSTCPQPAGPALAGCEIGHDLGLVAVELTLLPMVSAGLGAIAGAVGIAASAPAIPRKTPDRPSSVQAPIIFSGIMLVLFTTEMILKLV